MLIINNNKRKQLLYQRDNLSKILTFGRKKQPFVKEFFLNISRNRYRSTSNYHIYPL